MITLLERRPPDSWEGFAPPRDTRMNPDHASTYELIKALYAIDPSAAEIVVGPVAVRFNRLPALPEGPSPGGKSAAELELENAELKMKLSQYGAEDIY